MDSGTVCGDGTQEGAEECDDSNTTADDGCSADCTLECGDGAVTGSEICDPGIPGGTTGSCPTDCDDGMSCTSDSLSGVDCSVTCDHGDITVPVDDDMCCPTGATVADDNDCVGTCGDGFRTGAELCDTAIAAGSVGSCPTACDDGMACTADVFSMGGTCDAVCASTAITAVANGDGCCPAGATIGTDDDCAAACGDGVLSAGETCDTGIATGAGACPSACDDGMVCTTDALMNAGTCTAICGSTLITTPINGDGCCPSGATMATDTDCTGVCGDGIVQSGESCDTGLAGSCPTTCNDGMACTTDTLSGAGTCSAVCTAAPIATPMNGDGCCPTGATVGTDNDCPIACGDGVVSAGETCDTGLAGSCPATCSDGMVCTRDMLANAGTCTAACMFTPITAPMAGDGCCPTGATIGTDSDCPARCGDGVITSPETCDPPGGTCDATCRLTSTPLSAFRFTDLDIMEPHFFANVFGCRDVTNSPLGVDGLNPLLQDSIQLDDDGDGLLELSIAHVFAPLLQTAGSSTPSYVVFPDCSAPMSSTMCTLPAGSMRTPGTAVNMGAGSTCLGILTGTIRPYTPAIVTTTAAAGGTCYVASAGTVTFTLAGVAITLREAQIAGRWVGTPATSISNGLLRGFLTEADANAARIPAGTTGFGGIDGQTVGSLLRGGVGNCSTASPAMGDADLSVVDGTRGWYFYLNFGAALRPYSEL